MLSDDEQIEMPDETSEDVEESQEEIEDAEEVSAEESEEESQEDAETSDDEDTDEEAFIEMPLIGVVEAILFAARQPLKISQIAKVVGKGTKRDSVVEAIENLNAFYSEQERAFEVVEVSERYQLMSRPEYSPYIAKLLGRKLGQDKDKKLSPASLDTLSIIAYKQPIIRAEIEKIRGVGCGPILRQLIERGSVRVVGKKEDVIGHPLMYGTTESFMEEFGLGTLDELPMVHELRQMTGTTDPLPEPAAKEDPGFKIVEQDEDDIDDEIEDDEDDIEEDDIDDEDDDDEDDADDADEDDE